MGMQTKAVRRGFGRVPIAILAFTFALAVTPAAAQDTATGRPLGWPREIAFGNGTLTLYQPQVETLAGNLLSARAAASYQGSDGSEPTFGTLWFSGRIDADQDAGTAEVRDITVTRARWPEVTPEEERRVTESLTRTLAGTVVPVSMAALSASLASAQVEQESLEGLRHEPPRIVFSEEVAELVAYDGAPRTLPIPDTDLEQVANTPFAVIKDGGDYYLSGGKLWYSARDPMGPWTPVAAPPAEVARIVPPDTSSAPAPQPPPKIMTATEPTELVVTDGPPAWRPVGAGDLLYVENTETPIVREVATNDVYVLLSGRWFRSGSLSGPWTFVRPDSLPVAFREIPPASELGGARVAVAGTDEAQDAVLDAYVPQTAAIKRSEAKLEVTYDGTPKFETIEGTNIGYAVNTSAQVLRMEGRYYACDNAVWFVSDDPNGPWVVADEVPNEELAFIPPSSVAYNLTHVHVYDSTPEVVYVGYTPGYMWSYPYYGVPVYGTGWYYPPYWGPRYYYPRPPTWGLHVGYNPWYGWSFGFSWSYGFMNVGFSFGGGYGGYYRPGYRPGWGGGYYPPGGYRPPIIINTGDINIGNRVVAPGRLPAGGAAIADRGGNLYDRGPNRDRLADPATLEKANLARADRMANRPNNVLADRDGNVYQRNPGGAWQSREAGEWRPATPEVDLRPSTPTPRPATPTTRPATPTTRPATPTTRPAPQPATRQVPSAVQRDYGARVRGSTRAAPAGGARGGMGRRR